MRGIAYVRRGRFLLYPTLMSGSIVTHAPLNVTRRALLIASIAGAAGLAFHTAAAFAQDPQPTAVPVATLPVFPESNARARTVNEQPRVIEFYATWCRMCMEADVFVAQYAAAYRNIVAYRRIDVETQEGGEWVRRYQVPFVPTFAVERPDGQLDRLLYSTDAVLQDAARIARL
jgi:thiol:disulfide interchange protein